MTPADIAARTAAAVSETAHLLALIAAPRTRALDPERSSRRVMCAELRARIADLRGLISRGFVESSPDAPPRLPSFLMHLESLDALLSNPDKEEFSEEEITTARMALVTLGLDEPKVGWDAWDGSDAEEDRGGPRNAT